MAEKFISTPKTVVLLLVFLATSYVHAQVTRTANGPDGTNVLWHTASSWTPSGVPTALDSVVIPMAKRINIAAGQVASCKAIYFSPTNLVNGTSSRITVGFGSTLNVTNNVTFSTDAGISRIMHHIWMLGQGCQLNCNTLTMPAFSGGTGYNLIELSGGTLNMRSDLNIAQTNAGIWSGNAGDATVNIGGNTNIPSPTQAFNVRLTGNTVNYTGANQTILNVAYSNLKCTGSGVKTPSAGVTVADTLTIGSGVTLNMGGNALSGNLTTTLGSGKLQTQNTTTTALPSGKKWIFGVEYNHASTAQTIVNGTYGDLILNGTGVKGPSGALVVNSMLTIGTGGRLNMGGNALSGNLAGTSGTGRLQTQNTTATPLPSGKTWSFNVEYNHASVAQTIVNGSYAGLLITGTGSKTLAGTTTVSGALTFAGNSKLFINGQTLNINGTLVATTPINFSSSLTSSISIGGSGALGANLLFDQTSASTRSLNNLTINRGSSPTITLGNALNIIGTLTLSNGTLASGGNLTLISDVNGTARVATIPATSSITGNVTAQRYIPAVARRWRMFSPSITNFTSAALKDDIFVTGAGGIANGFDSSTLNQPTVCTYQESGSRGWVGISNINTTLTAGKGAIVFVRGDRTLSAPQWYTYPFVPQNAVTIDFTGPLNQGNISPSLTYTNTGSSADDGWNLVGNPYPSQINWNLLTKSNLSAFYYVYDPSTGSYVAQSGNSYIASSQSFFVQAIAASPSITFTESNKVANSSTNYFKTSNLPLEVRMIKDSLNSDVAWLAFNNSAQRSYSPSEDAIKLPNTTINMGFYIDSLTLLQYSAVPTAQATDTFILSTAADNGIYTLEFSNVSDGSQIPVYLKDLFTNNMIDLRSTSSYTFTISSDQASSGNRFLIIYADPSRLPVSWLSFSGSRSNKDVLLKWSTASEKNNRGFFVEKAEQGSNDWSVIGFVSGKGNNNTVNNYSFVDEIAFAHSNAVYYRIKQIDLDGTVSYSQVITLYSDKDESLAQVRVYPNPAQNNIYVDFNTGLVNASIEILDSYGELVTRGHASESSNRLEVSSLPPGIYLLRVMQHGQVHHVSRFVKN